MRVFSYEILLPLSVSGIELLYAVAVTVSILCRTENRHGASERGFTVSGSTGDAITYFSDHEKQKGALRQCFVGSAEVTWRKSRLLLTRRACDGDILLQSYPSHHQRSPKNTAEPPKNGAEHITIFWWNSTEAVLKLNLRNGKEKMACGGEYHVGHFNR